MRSVWRIVRDSDDAADAFQQAIESIWKHRRRIRGHENPTGYILRICVNAAYDVLRRRIKRKESADLEAIAGSLADRSPSAAQLLMGQEQRGEIVCAIAQLSRQQAQAVLLRLVEELPYGEVAQALGCSEATARTHVTRGRARLAELLAHLAPGKPKETGS